MPTVSFLLAIFFYFITNAYASEAPSDQFRLDSMVEEFQSKYNLYAFKEKKTKFPVEEFTDSSIELLSILLENTTLFRDINHIKLTHILKHMSYFSMGHEKVYPLLNKVFQRGADDLLCTLINADIFLGNLLVNLYQDHFENPKIYFDLLRNENDLMYAIIFAQTFLSSDSHTFRALNDILKHSNFRTVFIVRRFQSLNPQAQELLEAVTDEKKLKENQVKHLDFDSPYGRYAQVGSVIYDLLKFQRKWGEIARSQATEEYLGRCGNIEFLLMRSDHYYEFLQSLKDFSREFSFDSFKDLFSYDL